MAIISLLAQGADFRSRFPPPAAKQLLAHAHLTPSLPASLASYTMVERSALAIRTVTPHR